MACRAMGQLQLLHWLPLYLYNKAQIFTLRKTKLFVFELVILNENGTQ
jgi:hypothetical protein